MNRFTVSICMIMTLILFNISSAEIIYVPADYVTIQEGIDAAVPDDTVLVAPGTYTGAGNRDLDFSGKAIVVISEGGPLSTIIDCEGSADDPHRGFHFHSGEGTDSKISGFTIRGGYAAEAGSDASGGGINCDASSPTIEGNRIISNIAELNGGGIYADPYSSPVISDNFIGWNTAENTGGGIWCDNDLAVITGNAFIGNDGTFAGGGIYIDGASPLIEHSVIARNTAYWGGGVYCMTAALFIEGCTISMNTAGSNGGGVYCFYGTGTIITGTTLWGDAPDEIHFDSGNPVVSYSDVQGGWPGDGNIDQDPLFALPDRNDFRLLGESPCIDAGDTSILDPDGTRSDIGAHWFDQSDFLTLYMTPDTTIVGGGDVLGITFTAVNRRGQSEDFWFLSRAMLPNGASITVLGPEQFTIPAAHNAQVHVGTDIPLPAPAGVYTFESFIGVPPSTLYDSDSFDFIITR